MSSKFAHRVTALLLGAALAVLVGCYGPTNPTEKDEFPDLRAGVKDANAHFKARAEKASPPVRELYEAAAHAGDGTASLNEAFDKFKALSDDEKQKADPNLMAKIKELIFEASVDHMRVAQVNGNSGADVGNRLDEFAEVTKDPALKKAARAAKKVSGRPDEVSKEAVKEAVKESGDILKEKAKEAKEKPAELGIEEAPPELKQYEDKANNILREIQNAGNDAVKINKLLNDFASNEKLASNELAKALKNGTAKAGQVLGVAAGIAGAAANVYDLVKGWGDRDTMENLGAAAGALGGLLQAVQPMLTGAAPQWKAAAIAVCLILQQLLPNLGNILNLKLPGPDIFKTKGGKPPEGSDGKDNKDNKDNKGKGGNGPGKDNKEKQPPPTPKPEPKPFKPTPEQRKQIDEKAKSAEKAAKEKHDLPDQASIDPKKLEKAKDTIADSVSGGDPKVKEAVKIAIGSYTGTNLRVLSEWAASAAVAFKAGYPDNGPPSDK